MKISRLPSSEVEIEGEIDPVEIEIYRAEVMREITANLELPGFRKGQIPEFIAVKRIGEFCIFELMAKHALRVIAPKILTEQQIFPIAMPAVTITKLALGYPVGFKITATVMPEVTLPDYKISPRQ